LTEIQYCQTDLDRKSLWHNAGFSNRKPEETVIIRKIKVLE